jgi:hypothetical protein
MKPFRSLARAAHGAALAFYLAAAPGTALTAPPADAQAALTPSQRAALDAFPGRTYHPPTLFEEVE